MRTCSKNSGCRRRAIGRGQAETPLWALHKRQSGSTCTRVFVEVGLEDGWAGRDAGPEHGPGGPGANEMSFINRNQCFSLVGSTGRGGRARARCHSSIGINVSALSETRGREDRGANEMSFINRNQCFSPAGNTGRGGRAASRVSVINRNQCFSFQ